MKIQVYGRSRPSIKYGVASLLALAAAGSLTMACVVAPAHAQITVFDPGNYAQNLLTAARSLQQINNQIQALQNQATMLLNQSKNLSRIDFPQLQRLTTTMQQIDALMNNAQRIGFRSGQIDSQLDRLFPNGVSPTSTSDQRVASAQAELDAAMAACRHTMAVQAQVVGNIQPDAADLDTIVARSQGAEGALQASQATNQLLAVLAKQQFQLQQLMAAQFRAEAIDQAERAQEDAAARQATVQFLGSGTAYTPQ